MKLLKMNLLVLFLLISTIVSFSFLVEARDKDFLNNPDILHYSIKFDPIIFKDIMENGILSHDMAVSRGMYIESGMIRNNDGGDKISLNMGPKAFKYGINDDIDVRRFAFDRYSSHFVSFMVDSSSGLSLQDPTDEKRVGGEVLALEPIPVSKIVGVLIPEDMLNSKLSNIFLYFWTNFSSFENTRPRVEYILKKIPQETGYVGDTTAIERELADTFSGDYYDEMMSLDSWQRMISGSLGSNDYDSGYKRMIRINDVVQKYIVEAYGEDVTLLEVIKKYLPKGMKIYILSDTGWDAEGQHTYRIEALKEQTKEIQ